MIYDKSKIRKNIKRIFSAYDYDIVGKFKKDRYINDIDIDINIYKDEYQNLFKIIEHNFTIIYLLFDEFTKDHLVIDITKDLEKTKNPKQTLINYGFKINLKYIKLYPNLINRLIQINYCLGIFAYIYDSNNKLYEYYDIKIYFKTNHKNISIADVKVDKDNESKFYRKIYNKLKSKIYYWVLYEYFYKNKLFKSLKILTNKYHPYFIKEIHYYNKYIINKYTYQNIQIHNEDLPDMHKINKQIYRKYYNIINFIKNKCISYLNK
jgi:hypothetical protein